MSSETSADSHVVDGYVLQAPLPEGATVAPANAPAPKMPRFACLDALRSWMMLLGIVLHTANAHAIGCPHWWPVTDRFRHGAFDAFSFATHAFRMEVFFLLSGFFGRLLLRRYGLAGFITNRSRRILLPLAAGMVLMAVVQAAAVWAFVPLASAPAHFPDYVCTPWPSEVAAEPSTLWHPWFCHLWFLEYLALFYLGIVTLDVLRPRRWEVWMDRGEQKLVRLMRQHWMPLLMASLTTLALLPMRSWVVDTPLSLIPQARFFLYYGVFVALGWMMHRNPGLLMATARHLNWRNAFLLAASAVALVVFLWNVGAVPAHASWTSAIAIRWCASLCTWLAVLLVLGAMVLLLDQPSPTLRYLADASYWCYLIHLPIVLWLQGSLPANLAGPARFAVVLAIASAVSVATYHVFIRYTPLNEVFGSRRPVKARG